MRKIVNGRAWVHLGRRAWVHLGRRVWIHQDVHVIAYYLAFTFENIETISRSIPWRHTHGLSVEGPTHTKLDLGSLLAQGRPSLLAIILGKMKFTEIQPHEWYRKEGKKNTCVENLPHRSHRSIPWGCDNIEFWLKRCY